ncbi:MAG: DUF1993 domain-containing protein [Burkholderia gladioli]
MTQTPLSMYDASIPVFIRYLGNLSAILDRRLAYATEQGIDPQAFVGARLTEDMYALSAQIQRASDSAKGAGARLAGIEVPSYADTETTFPELRERIAKTIDFLNTIRPEQLEGSESRRIELKLRDGTWWFDGKSLLLSFSLPNFFFHVTTAYAILRHKGVPIGKFNYLGLQ